ncbi:alpha-hydroxy acid oxidase [Tenggerimyces flavus]|uniref:Alpha-hydroxy acid oxidase n=1 Tax=Tenggerimyces flavus TaxID=1708749 RepID=A0ABV7YK57_9ACTN|nr:alpha-hydroxy acid oxidase [Tenggerimyces flavus]MBM7789622.1 L-lactate dehydrogenase (cytochrome)/(S)-mandelate dehydrogenase [Tenggerimyces flavus]
MPDVFTYRLSSRSGPMSVEDYRYLAKRELPSMVWAFIEYGAEDLITLDANRNAFSRYALRTKVLTGERVKGTEVMLGGERLSLPVLLAPAGLVGLAHWTGELGAAQAAERAGTVSVLSTASTYTLEEVAGGTERDHFFQLYPWTDPTTGRYDLTHLLIKRARDAGFTGLFVTVDIQAHGNREGERKNGMGNPPVLTPARIASAAIRPAWWAALLKHRRYTTRILNELAEGESALRGVELQTRMLGADLTWDDFSWVRDHWSGPVFVKGILDADDAERAVALGADGVVVSNHGGRQLDGAVASLDALPAIAARIGDRATVLMDGGIRRGSDVVKALCLGADAVCIGRPYIYGAAVYGPAGVQHVIEILREEIVRVLTLMGVSRLDELGPSWLTPADAPVTL